LLPNEQCFLSLKLGSLRKGFLLSVSGLPVLNQSLTDWGMRATAFKSLYSDLPKSDEGPMPEDIAGCICHATVAVALDRQASALRVNRTLNFATPSRHSAWPLGSLTGLLLWCVEHERSSTTRAQKDQKQAAKGQFD
jgi:hypothetical protein